MRNLTILLLFILTCFTSCKDDCLTCPDNEAVIDGECQCIGLHFKGDCKGEEASLEPKFLHGTSVLFQPFYSEAINCSSAFDFNNQPLFIYISKIIEYDGLVSAVLAIETEARLTNTHFEKVYYSGLESEASNFDSLAYDWSSAYEYSGFVYVGEDGIGVSNPEHYTTEIDGQTCYLRPYIKILDKDYIRVTFRYVTKSDEVKAECVRLFHK
ncbi:MAG: hypothetical protein COA58_04650 [Bacteroidetes bacterium]|nr:MAG: hypothetical protein COA58_04650 [Bacteroidota bacterium]